MNRILITGGSGFIGTNLIELLITKGYTDIVNLDKSAPLKKSHSRFWVEGNIMDEAGVWRILETGVPEILIHLAARTDTLSSNLEDYSENTIGTQNVINAVKKLPTIKHFINTSTQYVYKSLENPVQLKDDEYKPHTIYGYSKVLGEEYTRKGELKCAWTIVRPSNIWGPWHMRYPVELWRIIDKGLYLHPGGKEVIRTYGYVKNIAHQIVGIINAPLETVDKKTYYLGDLPIDSYVWLNELSKQLTGKKVIRLPASIFKVMALTGDVLRNFKIPFPLYSERYRNMVEDYVAPTNVTVARFGVQEPDLRKNVAETIAWVKGEGRGFFKYWRNK